ncbi:MAG: alpha/beta hydrolase [Pseudolabrys sp.]|nr:alpha/beta hydrolase [Pseudolabrys sp.]MBV9955364.1 alpha/beta hydrolase [Pseudolabrys sp.]
MQQEIKYCTTSDGVRLAYSIIGSGEPPMVRTPHWFAHLEHDLESPLFGPMIQTRTMQHRLLRYDPRGVGLSHRDNVDLNFERLVADLETVVDAAQLDKFILFGLSQGASLAVAYAARHPERLTHLILFGGFARGLLRRDNSPKQKENLELACALIRNGWGSQEESYRQFFTSQFIPDAGRDLHHSLNETQRLAATPDVAERILRLNAEIDVAALLPQIKTPTLVLHSTDDLRVPYAFARDIAAAIPNATLVPLESRNHLLVADEPANRVMADAISDFLGDKRIRRLPGTAGLTKRLEKKAHALEQNWFIKFVLVFAAITGCFIFFYEIWKLYRGGAH